MASLKKFKLPQINESGKVGFKQAVIDMFKGYFNFSGRTTRAGYWWGTLILYLYAFAVWGISIYAGLTTNKGNISLYILGIGFLLALFPYLTLSVRRYRDTGWTNKGIWTYYCFNVIFTIAVYLWPTNSGVRLVDSLLSTISFIALIVISDSMTTVRTEKWIRFFLREKTTEVRELNEAGKVSFKQAFIDAFKGYATFGGKTTRAGYWWIVLVVAAIVSLGMGLAYYGMVEMSLTLSSTPQVMFITGLIILAVISCLAIIPMMTLSIRRLRDAGLTNTGIGTIYAVLVLLSLISSMFSSGTMAMVMLVISLLMQVLILVLLCLPTQKLATQKNTKWARWMFQQI